MSKTTSSLRWAALAASLALAGCVTPGGGIVSTGGSPTAKGGILAGISASNAPKNSPAPIPVARIADCLANPGKTIDFNGRQLSYPDIKLVYVAGGNPFHHHQDTNNLLKAWRKPQTVIVHEPYWTATAKHADIVLRSGERRTLPLADLG